MPRSLHVQHTGSQIDSPVLSKANLKIEHIQPGKVSKILASVVMALIVDTITDITIINIISTITIIITIISSVIISDRLP